MRYVTSSVRWIFFITIALFYIIRGYVFIPFGRASAYYQGIGKGFGGNLMRTLGAKPKFEGLELLDSAKKYVFVGNHQSYADILIVQASLAAKKIYTLFMAKQYLFKIPFLGLAIKHMGLVPVDYGDTRQALRSVLQAIDRVKEGNNLVVFPEGSRSCDGEIAPFKRGAFMLAERMGVPVIPFVITGTFDVVSRNSFFIKPGPCKIKFLPAEEKGTDTSKEFMARVEGIIRKEYDEARVGS